MTVEAMADRMVKTVETTGGGVTFAEIVNAIGEEANGDRELGFPERNVVLWPNVSENFVKAFNLAKAHIYPKPSHFLTYLMDGMVPQLPVAKQVGTPYKKPHWLPVVLWSKH